MHRLYRSDPKRNALAPPVHPRSASELFLPRMERHVAPEQREHSLSKIREKMAGL
jgi:hypothetical protein